jgi:hypothetical protein
MPESMTRRTLLVVAAIALAFAYWWPAFRLPHATGFGDWQMVHHNWEVGLVALTRHHELPLFDPYHCGGVTMLGNPESQIFSPLFLLAFPFGTTLATKLFIALHTAFALLGSFHYARRIAGLSSPAATLSAVVFAGSGFFAWHLAGGHATFAPFAFLPWLHVAFRASSTSPRAAIAGGLLLALAIAEGGTYPFPYMLVSLGVSAAFQSIAEPRLAPRVLRSLGVMGLVTLVTAAHRILPIRATLARLPRTIGSSDSSTPSDVITMLTSRDHEWAFAGHEFVWPEYCTYVGVAVLVLSGLGVLRGLRRPSRAIAAEHVVGAVVAALLILGNASAFYPWVVLRELPVYDSLRVPSRFAAVLTFHLGVLAGLGLDWLDARTRTGRSRAVCLAVATLVVVAIAVDITIVTRPIVDRWTNPAIDGTVVAPALALRASGGYDAVYASLPRRNEATTLCYVGGMNWEVSPALQTGDVPQVSSPDVSTSVAIERRTPGSYLVDVRARRRSRVVLNQNYDPDFRASYGRVVNDRGLLAVEVPPGHRKLAVRYRPSSLAPAFAITALGLLLSAIAIARLRRWPDLGSLRKHRT